MAAIKGVELEARHRRMAELAVSVGANVQPGQLVVVAGLVEHVPLMRAIAAAAYRAGARRVVKTTPPACNPSR